MPPGWNSASMRSRQPCVTGPSSLDYFPTFSRPRARRSGREPGIRPGQWSRGPRLPLSSWSARTRVLLRWAHLRQLQAQRNELAMKQALELPLTTRVRAISLDRTEPLDGLALPAMWPRKPLLVGLAEAWECHDCQAQVGLCGDDPGAVPPTLGAWFAAIGAVLANRSISPAELQQKLDIRRLATVRAVLRKILAAIDSPDADRLLAGLPSQLAHVPTQPSPGGARDPDNKTNFLSRGDWPQDHKPTERIAQQSIISPTRMEGEQSVFPETGVRDFVRTPPTGERIDENGKLTSSRTRRPRARAPGIP